MELGARGEQCRRIVELPDHTVIADAAKADPGFDGAARIADEHDVTIRRQDISGPFCEATLQADVDGPAQVPGGEVGGLTNIEQCRSGGGTGKNVVDTEQRRCGVIEQRVELAVTPRIELEILRARRLALSDHVDEGVLVHRLQRVVGLALLADGRTGVARQVLAAR